MKINEFAVQAVQIGPAAGSEISEHADVAFALKLFDDMAAGDQGPFHFINSRVMALSSSSFSMSRRTSAN